MFTHLRRRGFRAVIAATGLGLVAAPLALMSPSQAAIDGSDVVISEVYGGGGNSGATLKSDFIELYNPTDAAISLEGMSLQYRSSTASSAPSASGVFALNGSVPAQTHWLVKAADGAAGTADLPTPDATSSFAMGGPAGQVYLSSGSTALNPGTGSTLDPAVVDLVGYGAAATTYEGSGPTATLSNTTSAARTSSGADTDDNSADFLVGTPDPESSGGSVDPEPEEPVARTIQEIQGTGVASPIVDTLVDTTGVVTAAYGDGGYDGFYLQTPGSGDVDLATHDGSDAVFVYSPSEVDEVEIGDLVSVTGQVKEFYGLTQVAASAAGVEVLSEPAEAVKAAVVAFPSNDAQRESLEGMLVDPQGGYTITDNYSLNQYADMGLATGSTTLRQPTDIARPGTPGYTAAVADIEARGVRLDDGASTNFLSSANQDIALPYLTNDNQIRVGATADFTQEVVLDYRNDVWKFQPTTQLLASEQAPATFQSTRTSAPEAVGGDVQIGTFNVLNYFSTTGDEAGCTSFYNDRDGNPITVRSCGDTGPRGAANQESFLRQQAKIVQAINALGVDVVSLEEIENSSAFDQDRDAALADLVAALNADAGSQVWSYVPSPTTLPADEDVIRTAFIFKAAAVELVGESEILIDDAFTNARQPLAAAFKPAGGTADQSFTVIANHFKSKGGDGTGANADQGDGQGSWNAARVGQATALADFADDFAVSAETAKVFLVGDFNSYTEEDPMHVLYDAGYTNLVKEETDESTYLFGGVVGSLDHVLANPAAEEAVMGVDVWNINSVEPLALEYSRYNSNLTNFYQGNPFRSSDHDPAVVGFTSTTAPAVGSSTSATADTITYGEAGTVEVTVTSDQPATGDVEVVRGDTVLGTDTLENGVATVTLDETALAPGAHLVKVHYLGAATVEPSTTSLAVHVVRAEPTVTAEIDDARPVVKSTKTELVAQVSAPGFTVVGVVEVLSDGETLGSGTLDDGTATIALDAFDSTGLKNLRVRYTGSDLAKPAETSTQVKVVKATPEMAVDVKQREVKVKQTRPDLEISLTAPHQTVTGYVAIHRDGEVVGLTRLKNGQANFELQRYGSVGQKTVTVDYLGSDTVRESTRSITFRVVR